MYSGQKVTRRWGGSRLHGRAGGQAHSCSNFLSCYTPRPPAPPQAYTLPGVATLVHNTTELNTAIGASAANIVCAAGTYDAGASTYFSPAGSSIYSQTLGGAVFTSGFSKGSGSGVTYQGLAFNVSDTAKTLQGACVNLWGTSSNVSVLDCTFEGNSLATSGLFALAVSGLTAQRLSIKNFTDYGLFADNLDNNAGAIAYHDPTDYLNIVSDIDVNKVTRATPGEAAGTAEAGVWIGNPVTNNVSRIRTRNTSWMAVWTGNSIWDTVFSDIDLDGSGAYQSADVGFYMEHFTRHCTFQNFKAKGCYLGFNGEWDDGTPGNGAVHNLTIQNGTIDATGAKAGNTSGGLFSMSEAVVMTGVRLFGQNWGGVSNYQEYATGSSFAGNDFSGVLSGVTHVRTDLP